MQNIEETAKAYGLNVNPDKDRVTQVLRKLEATKGYCPCMPARNQETLCPCLFMRKHKACRCGLYVRGENA